MKQKAFDPKVRKQLENTVEKLLSIDGGIVLLRGQLSAITGNTDTIEALQQGTTDALNATALLVDQVESLLSTLNANVDQVESLLQALGLNTDQVESLIESSNKSLGLTSEAIYSGTGSSGIVGILKGVYAAVKGVLNIRKLSSSTDSVNVGNFPATQNVSVLSMPQVDITDANITIQLAKTNTTTAISTLTTAAKSISICCNNGATYDISFNSGSSWIVGLSMLSSFGNGISNISNLNSISVRPTNSGGEVIVSWEF